MPGTGRAFGAGRVTRARGEIAAVVSSAQGVFTVDELATDLRDKGSSVGLATIYRAVGAMEAAGYIERVGSRGTTALYAHCETAGHHHHLVCTTCGRVAHTACPLDSNALGHLGDEGFVVTGHEIVLYGLCPGCAENAKPGGA